MIAAHRVEIRRRRKHGGLKEALIPTAAVDPRGRSRRARGFGNRRQNLRLRQPSQIEALELLSDAREVHVRIGQTRYADAGNLHASSRRRGEALDLGDGADRDDAAVRHCDSVGPWT